MSIKPDKTCALIVGVAHYQAGSDWDLNGPAHDAAQFANWLHNRQVLADLAQLGRINSPVLLE